MTTRIDRGTGPDLRDGEKIAYRPDRVPKHVESYRQPDGSVALWDPTRWAHVAVPADVSEASLTAALFNLNRR